MRKPFVILWAGFACLLLFFWIYLPLLSRYRDLKGQQDEMSQEVKVLDSRIQELKEERELLKSDMGYLEKVMRDQLGLVKPGEMVYKFVPDTEKSASHQTPAPQTAAPASQDSTSPAASAPRAIQKTKRSGSSAPV